jgi:hypothetical protein
MRSGRGPRSASADDRGAAHAIAGRVCGPGGALAGGAEVDKPGEVHSGESVHRSDPVSGVRPTIGRYWRYTVWNSSVSAWRREAARRSCRSFTCSTRQRFAVVDWLRAHLLLRLNASLSAPLSISSTEGRQLVEGGGSCWRRVRVQQLPSKTARKSRRVIRSGPTKHAGRMECRVSNYA